MKFLMLIKSNANTEAGVPPDEKLLVAMGKYNEELIQAGVLVSGEGLRPSSRGARVRFSGGKRTVIDGPFTETKELIAGFWIIQVNSKEEAIEWAKRVPYEAGPPSPDGEPGEIELREVYDGCVPENLKGSPEVERVLAAEREFRQRTNT